MKLTLKTLEFKNMVAKASRGAGQNKLLPITSMMCIEKKDSKLHLRTTDTLNYLDVRCECPDGDDFYAVVPVDTFSKLISKLTSEKLTLSLTDSDLEVSANGKYKIPLPVDEDGMVQFPSPVDGIDNKLADINLTTVKAMIASNKSAMSDRLDTPCYCGYYVGNKVITTDENVISFNLIDVLPEPLLITPDMMELMAMSSQEKIAIYYSDGMLKVVTDELVIVGPEQDDKQLFPIEDIEAYLDESFTSMCEVPKASLLNVLDRLSLFIHAFDKNGAYFTFTKRGLDISSKKSDSSELLSYIKSENFTAFKCCVDIPQFKAQLDSIPTDEVKIWYGNDNAIKLEAGNIVQIISLLEDDSLDSGKA
jgi:hypothetical protein